MKTKPLSVLILAAGLGTRMKSKTPKVLHRVAGRSLIEHVFGALAPLKARSVGVVVGHEAAQVTQFLSSLNLRASFFRQKRLLGSGDAVRQAASWLKKQKGDVLVLCGDSPLLRPETLKALVGTHRASSRAATVLTSELPDAGHYGRIVRRADDSVERIVEAKDASPEVLQIREFNSGVYCFDAQALVLALPRLKADNAKGEYYLTDVIQILRESGSSVGAHLCPDAEEALGVNRRRDLAEAESILRRRIVEYWMDEGVTFIDPSQTYVSAQARIGSDTVIYPGTHLAGRVRVGEGCRIGPFAYLEDSVLGDDVEFIASFAKGAKVKSGVRVGPFSRLREGAVIEEGAHIGNFSEIKKSRVGKGSKVNHLSYIGDTLLGEGVNVGAGTITCNYDGVRKNRTVIGKGSFIGSNVNLVAPVTVGKDVVVGAGSTITRSVPDGALVIERASQVIKKGWTRKRFSRKETHR
jgi:bifunctional UDP-N-acetylglucosamine pyrophosphorylase/glucosamine-1-phosphate N-acetyltransferase